MYGDKPGRSDRTCCQISTGMSTYSTGRPSTRVNRCHFHQGQRYRAGCHVGLASVRSRIGQDAHGDAPEVFCCDGGLPTLSVRQVHFALGPDGRGGEEDQILQKVVGTHVRDADPGPVKAPVLPTNVDGRPGLDDSSGPAAGTCSPSTPDPPVYPRRRRSPLPPEGHPRSDR